MPSETIKVKGGSDGQEDNNMFVAPLDWVDTMNRMLKVANIDAKFRATIITWEGTDRSCILHLKTNDLEIETEVLDLR